MKLDEYRGCITYKASCSCFNSDHDLFIYMEKDEGFNILNLRFYADIKCSGNFDLWDQSPFSKKLKKILSVLWNRTKISLRVMFLGKIEMEQEFVINDEEQINDFIKALEDGKKYLK